MPDCLHNTAAGFPGGSFQDENLSHLKLHLENDPWSFLTSSICQGHECRGVRDMLVDVATFPTQKSNRTIDINHNKIIGATANVWSSQRQLTLKGRALLPQEGLI
jgi:hypothetical protein